MSNILDIYINQHATFAMTMNLTNVSGSAIDITLWEFSGSIKTSFKEPAPLAIFDFEKLVAVSGSIQAQLPSTESGKLNKTEFYYDIVAINPTTTPIQVLRVLQGKVLVDLGVTDPPVQD